MDVELPAVRDLEQAQHLDRVLGEVIVGGNRQPPAPCAEAFDVAAEQPGRQPQQAAALVARLERGAEDARQIADVLRDQEVMLHEALDARRAGVVAIAHAAGELGLQVEGQPLLGPVGEVVQVAAHRPQEVLRLGEAVDLRASEQADIDQLRHVR